MDRCIISNFFYKAIVYNFTTEKLYLNFVNVRFYFFFFIIEGNERFVFMDGRMISNFVQSKSLCLFLGTLFSSIKPCAMSQAVRFYFYLCYVTGCTLLQFPSTCQDRDLVDYSVSLTWSATGASLWLPLHQVITAGGREPLDVHMKSYVRPADSGSTGLFIVTSWGFTASQSNKRFMINWIIIIKFLWNTKIFPCFPKVIYYCEVYFRQTFKWKSRKKNYYKFK